ncbi:MULTISPECIES: hypothetical protein [unclassified Sulfurospirillum]|uniref:hypothetical protein n=1 Tax=unclassified Sulfurospirillum TaxID=2618290 RepID=UPI00050092D7|nr:MULTISPECIES: hypothetical protein [unclassified Sulfurospirillum]KFL33780.1 hypothetical protein JU57_09585 [Sulfurospirillum sp. SCADC]
MVKLTHGFFALCMALGCCLTPSLADTTMGADIFKKEMRTICGFSGNVMAKKHTQKEWQHLYEAKTLQEALISFCPNAKPLTEASLKHLYDFLYHFASDSGNTALCY